MPRPRIHNARPKRFRLILAAAEKHFAERGFDSVRLDDVAVAAGIRRETLLQYLPSKEALFRAACGQACSRLDDGVRAIALQAGAGEDRAERARASTVAILEADHNLARLLLRGMIEGEGSIAFLPVSMVRDTLTALARTPGGSTLRAEVEAALVKGAGSEGWEAIWAEAAQRKRP